MRRKISWSKSQSQVKSSTPYKGIEFLIDPHRDPSFAMLRAAVSVAVAAQVAEAFVAPSLPLTHGVGRFAAAGVCDAHSALPLSSHPAGVVARERGGMAAACRMAGKESTPGMSRKEKQRLKKKEKEEQRKVRSSFRETAEGLTDDLMDEVESGKRDLGAIASCIEKLRELQQTLPAGSEVKSLPGDWKLAYAASSGTVNEFGTGLGGLPGTTVEDMFVSFGEKGAIEVYEICRILGPFPSVRNKLDGTFEFKKKAAGFAGEAVSEEGLYMKYTQLTDGRDKVTTAATGFKTKEVRVDVEFVSDEILVAKVGGQDLVFEREEALQKEVARLMRADLTKEGQPEEEPVSLIENIAQVATGAKSPWDAIFKR